ncbi:MAG: hypothetical protein HYZ53_01270 [Planctomycetes bacterium]|nr:hypothetical protein [Planctomycetota bacterium]
MSPAVPPHDHLYRLVNVPFLHAKPTWGDVSRADPDPRYEHRPAWDAANRGYDQIRASLWKDGGRYAIILDYRTDHRADYRELNSWLEKKHDIIAEGQYGPNGDRLGRLYLAVPSLFQVEGVLALLASAPAGYRFTLVHPLDDDESEETAGPDR